MSTQTQSTQANSTQTKSTQTDSGQDNIALHQIGFNPRIFGWLLLLVVLVMGLLVLNYLRVQDQLETTAVEHVTVAIPGLVDALGAANQTLVNRILQGLEQTTTIAAVSIVENLEPPALNLSREVRIPINDGSSQIATLIVQINERVIRASMFSGLALAAVVVLAGLAALILFYRRGSASAAVISTGDYADTKHRSRSDSSTQQAGQEKAMQAKGDVLATMSHEIRTPMNGVLGMTQLLKETPLSEKQHKYINIVNSSGQYLLDVLNNILDFSKIEAGKMEVENIPFNLADLIDDCVGVFSLKALEKSVVLTGGLDYDVPRVVVGDPTRLRQVMMNLLANAIKFTFEGHVSLFVRKSNEQKGDGIWNLKFEVRDNGIGISTEQQSRLFQAFSQSEASTTRKYGGTGLGLYISKQLLNLMQGSIEVESSLGAGAVFKVGLSLGEPSAPGLAALESVNDELQDCNLLIVDSDDSSAAILAAHARYWNLNVVTVSTSKDALKILNGNQDIQVVLVAEQLEDGTGMALASTIDTIPQLADTTNLVLMKPLSIDNLDDQTNIPGVFKVLERPVSNSLLKSTLIEAQEGQLIELAQPDTVDRQNFSDVRALIAEDNEVNQMIIKGILKKFEINPVVVSDGAVAVEKTDHDQQEFDLILMDCEMPVMNGWDATEKIREHERQRHVENPMKIVALSAHVVSEPRERALAVGMDKFVAKPVSIESVESLLHEYFPRGGGNESVNSGRLNS